MKKWFYRAGAGIAGVLFVASAMTVVAPKTVHALVSALVTVANTSSNPVPVQRVKESAANFISVSTGPANPTTYNEVLPDGTVGSTPFSIPAGEQFVITDVNWVTTCDTSSNCGRSVGDAVVLMLGGSGGGVIPGSYMSQAIYARNSGVFLTAGRSDRLKSGLVVTQLPAPAIFEGRAFSENISVVTLRGYLVP